MIFKSAVLLALIALVASQCNCPTDLCCSKWGYCGTSDAYCSPAAGCQQNCHGTPTPPTSKTDRPLPTTDKPTHSKPDPTHIKPIPPTNSTSKFVVYLDQPLSWNRDAKEFAVPGSVPAYSYNVVNLAFWLSTGVADAALDWAALGSDQQKTFIDAYHKAGVKLLVSAFGATEFPTNLDATAVANNLAAFVKKNNLDGVDIDWEDSAAFEPAQAGKGEAWLTKLTQTLRQQLPRPYIITHAPQAPYFVNNTNIYPKGAYLAVHRDAGKDIDWYNVQFYNQGDSSYDTCDKLLYKAGGGFDGTALFEIVNNGVDAQKLVIGKPITQAGAVNTGYMTADALAKCFKEAKTKGWKAGAMGWEFKLDTFGWSNTLAQSLQ